jgi:biopolymer transport protein ExbD
VVKQIIIIILFSISVISYAELPKKNINEVKPILKSKETINRVAKVSISRTGEIKLNGKIVSFKKLENSFKSLKDNNGVVWYFRENPEEESPPSQAIKVINLIMDMNIPVRLSSKPDFSDSIDSDGRSVSSKAN